MVIYGKPIADKIYQQLKPQIAFLRNRKVIPTLAIILVGNDFASCMYIKNKKEKANKLGIKVIVNQQKETVAKEKLIEIIKKYNNDRFVHGIVVQLPLPAGFPQEEIIKNIAKEKDVDGFLPNSPFVSPVACAIYYILKEIIKKSSAREVYPTLNDCLQDKKIVIVGKGKTGGSPIFKELSCKTDRIIQIDQSSKNPDFLIKQADIVISCVGKERIVNRNNCKKGAVVIGVGLTEKHGKLKGDFEEKEILDIASFYTPTPGGVGPISVACLFKNLVKASTKYTPSTPKYTSEVN